MIGAQRDESRYSPAIALGSFYVATGFSLWGLDESSFADVSKGEGKLLTIDGNKVAAYRDEKGSIHAVSAVCPHFDKQCNVETRHGASLQWCRKS
ncbi:MAG: Rieske 2Fe-2S domain-containing protein [Coleofasciculus sp. A1-SPW-01]